MKLLQTFLFIAFLLLSACTASGKQPEAVSTIAPLPASQAQPAEDSQYVVKTWVRPENPEPGEQVMVVGSLLKKGVFLGGMMMYADWPEGGVIDGIPNCDALVLYQTARCYIINQGFPAGEFVPVYLTFRSGDKVITGQTGFTPK